jgi:uncharacterized protein (DUF1501 family)
MSQLSRRSLLGASLLSSFSLLLDARSGRAAVGARNPVVVCVFLRGAADGLNVVVPHAHDDYYALRRTIAVPRPGGKDGAIELDGQFGLHPRLEPLKAAYDAGELALVHAVGSPHPTRSHFEAQDYMETAQVGRRSASEGWLARYLRAKPAAQDSLIRAVALASRAPLALRGYPDAIIAPRLRDFRLRSSERLEPVLSRGFERLYRADAGELAERAGGRALLATSELRRVFKSKPSVVFPRDTREFADVAQLIRADIGLETAWIDLGGFDTHRDENGELPRQLYRLARGLEAFRAELGPELERVVVLVMTEFGRTARENGTGGSDHGHGSVMLVLGGKVQGGKVYGAFPGLRPEQLYEQRDLDVSTDFRDVLAEVCERHLAAPNVAALFPGHAHDPARRLGLFV